jgi:5-methyltetrahydropteroyltriglutamate--homocysteine methyltransferase
VNLTLTSAGSYPRIGETAELQVLRRTLAAADRGERTAADLADAENTMIRQAIEEQARAGVELLTDGLIRWYDPVSHLAGKLEGVKINGLLRFFDTNFYFRQPVLHARPRRRPAAALVVEEFRFATNVLGAIPTPPEKAGKRSIKAVLTGPYTLAKFSLVESAEMGSLEARAQAYAEALAAEVRALAEAGAEFIQVDEPAILKYPQDWGVFRSALEPLAAAKKAAAGAGKKTALGLCVYFYDPAPLYDKLAQLPVDVLGLDFTYNPRLVDTVAAAGAPVALQLGLVDGRNTKLEDPAGVARQIERMAPKLGQRAYLAPSCGLEYLPRDRAYAKLELLEKTRQAVAA